MQKNETFIRRLIAYIRENRILPLLLLAAVIGAACLFIHHEQAPAAFVTGLLISYGLIFPYMRKETRRLDALNETLLEERNIRQEFFANASHELKTPITSIRGYAELLEQGLVTDEETKKDMVRRIRTEADRMTALIQDLLAISRLETNEIRIEPTEVDMTKLIADRMAAFEPKARESGVTLYNYSMNHVRVTADCGHMEELINNLVSNAIRYNRRNGKVWVDARNEDGYLILRVRDTGIGIAEEETKKIFNRFYRVDKGRSRESGGTGLGLAIVKHIVGYYHGSLELQSKPGEGSSFIVRIPETGVAA